jgi:hypothetical protein
MTDAISLTIHLHVLLHGYHNPNEDIPTGIFHPFFLVCHTEKKTRLDERPLAPVCCTLQLW